MKSLYEYLLPHAHQQYTRVSQIIEFTITFSTHKMKVSRTSLNNKPCSKLFHYCFIPQFWLSDWWFSVRKNLRDQVSHIRQWLYFLIDVISLYTCPFCNIQSPFLTLLIAQTRIPVLSTFTSQHVVFHLPTWEPPMYQKTTSKITSLWSNRI